jgi:hypothetical protein
MALKGSGAKRLSVCVAGEGEMHLGCALAEQFRLLGVNSA